MNSKHNLIEVAKEMAPHGVFRVGLNMANFLLVRANSEGQDPSGMLLVEEGLRWPDRMDEG